MNPTAVGSLLALLEDHESTVLSAWGDELNRSEIRRDLVNDAELRLLGKEFLALFTNALRDSDRADARGPGWAGVREMLAGMSRSRALQGYSPSETATFVFSLKKPLFDGLSSKLGLQSTELGEALWEASRLLDQLGLYTTEVYQQTRDEIIARQQEEMLELSTPVVMLWKGILALPIIGTLDSARTQTMMDSLLEKIVATGAQIAIIDITGVPTVDTLVAQHLLKTVTAARLMGADCIISGIRPQIAQTIVHLGVELGTVRTKGSLADAFALALREVGGEITNVAPRPPRPGKSP